MGEQSGLRVRWDLSLCMCVCGMLGSIGIKWCRFRTSFFAGYIPIVFFSSLVCLFFGMVCSFLVFAVF